MSVFEIVMLTPDRVPGALEVLRSSFFNHESVCVFFGLGEACNAEAVIELEHFNENAAEDNVSLAAVDPRTKEILAVAFNKIQVRSVPGGDFFEKYIQENIKTEIAAGICRFMGRIEGKLNLFDYFNADCCIDLMTLAVKPSARGRGLARELVRSTIQLAREYQGDPKPAFVSAIFTSKYAQAAGQAEGMVHLLEIPFAELDFNGRKFNETTGSEHHSCTFSAIKL